MHRTAIFDHITDLVHHIVARKGFVVWNYIDDIYACCHTDVTQAAFHDLLDTIRLLGLLIYQKKVFPPAEKVAIMGIVVDVKTGTFNIEDEKSLQISSEYI